MKIEVCNPVLGNRFFIINDFEKIYFVHIGEEHNYIRDLTGSIFLPKSGLFMCKYIEKMCNGKIVLDLGTGYNALLANHALEYGAERVDAVDIDHKALDFAKKKFNNKKLNIFYSDIFEKTNNQFYDLIISNPPQMPEVNGKIDFHNYCGLTGRETIEKILKKVNKVLNLNGKFLLLSFGFLGIDKATSFRNQSIKEYAKQYGMKMTILDKYIIPIRKGGVLQSNIEYIKRIYPLYNFIVDNSEIYNEIYILQFEKQFIVGDEVCL